jgi:hypothetical protein
MNPRIDTELQSPEGAVQMAIRMIGRAILVMRNIYGTKDGVSIDLSRRMRRTVGG